MSLDVSDVSGRTGVGPLYASAGQTSYDQLLQRMKDEAVSNRSNLVKLKHLLAALATSPNGKARVQFLDLLRSGDIPDQELRRLLGLSNSTTIINTDADLNSSEIVRWIIGEAVRFAGIRGTRPETIDVFNALVKYFQRSDEQRVEHAEVRLIDAIKNGSVNDM